MKLFKQTGINTFRLLSENEDLSDEDYPIVLDIDGKEKLFYHGTSKDYPLYHFGLKRPEQHFRHGVDTEGDIFFTDDKISAGYYGHKYIITAILRGIIGKNIQQKQENLSHSDYVDYPYNVYIVKDRRQVMPIKKETLPPDHKGIKELPDFQKYYDKYKKLAAAGEV